MKRSVLFLLAVPLAVLAAPLASAQTMMGQVPAQISTTTEEQQGQDIFNKLQSNGLSCAQLTDANFDLLGEFFMGRMLGACRHESDDDADAGQ